MLHLSIIAGLLFNNIGEKTGFAWKSEGVGKEREGQGMWGRNGPNNVCTHE
jgi:hypothetical protein